MELIEIDQLTKSFGGLRAVDGVSLKIREGEVVSVIGPNGAGKSTLFNLITGYIEPDGGKVLLDGEEITRLPIHKMVTKGIARSFQSLNVFSELTVHENVRMGIQARMGHGGELFRSRSRLQGVNEKIPEIVERVGLAGKERMKAKDLSYGDNKILDVAIALTATPRILLMDEPTSGLARRETGRMLDLIMKLSEHLTILLVEHDMNVVFTVSERVVVMNQGKVIAEGKPDEIRKDKAVQEAYLGGEG